MTRPLLTLCLFLSVAAMAGLAGCTTPPLKPDPPKYPTLPLRSVPSYMKGTLYELTDLENDTVFTVSGWGLAVNLDATGGSTRISNNLRAFMAKELEARGFGSRLNPQLQYITPETVLNDKNTAVVGVIGLIPPGARKGQWFDITAYAASDDVVSLAKGRLYDTPLTIGGADPTHPTTPVNVFATARGPLFVNPASALQSGSEDAKIKRDLQVARVIGGGQVINDRPLLLRLRQPETRLSRTIEFVVNDYFHQDRVCTAFDLGMCQLWTPSRFGGDWEHFTKLVLHMYLQGGSESFARAKARELAAEAKKPGAPLQDISYCMEGLGQNAMSELLGMLSDNKLSPDVRFAAARAAAYIGDSSGAAQKALLDFANDDRSNFQLAAVQVFGHIPNNVSINRALRPLLDSEKTTVRVEAYSILARNHDPAVDTRILTSSHDPGDQKFALDFVHSRGAPLIYATMRDIPRIAIFGRIPQLRLPMTFAAMDNHFMIASGQVGREVTIFYRESSRRDPVTMTCPANLVDVIARLAGQIADGPEQLDFTYAEVLAILQGLSDQHRLTVTSLSGQELAAALMIQEAPEVSNAIDTAPLLDRGRPQGDNAAPKLDAPAARPQGPVGLVSGSQR